MFFYQHFYHFYTKWQHSAKADTQINAKYLKGREKYGAPGTIRSGWPPPPTAWFVALRVLPKYQ
jgi:hypothetical protein